MIELDIRGEVCPNATGFVFTAMRELPLGETLLVTSDYPPARSTIQDLVRQVGGTCDLRELEGSAFLVEIRKTVESRSKPERRHGNG